MILVIDNYDSFTFNLVQYLGELGKNWAIATDIQVFRNDKITLDEVRQLNPDGIVISPGPGRPDDAGVSIDIIRELCTSQPILGVCLGHQSMGQVFGGNVVAAPELMHGKTSPIVHKNVGIFTNIESPMEATRYHSLVIDRDSCPDCLEITAWVEDGTIMGVRHRDYNHIEGVQFHPESILTKVGKNLLENWLTAVQSFQDQQEGQRASA